MRLRPEVHDTDIPRIVDAFVGITGIEEWERRLTSLNTQLTQNEFLSSYIAQIYALELEFARVLEEIAKTGQIDLRAATVDRYLLFAFITAVTKTYERLGSLAQKRLRGMILGGLRDSGLSLRRAATNEIADIIRILASWGLAPFRFQVKESPDGKGFVVAPENEWRFFVAEFSGSNEIAYDAQIAANLLEPEIRFLLTLLWRDTPTPVRDLIGTYSSVLDDMRHPMPAPLDEIDSQYVLKLQNVYKDWQALRSTERRINRAVQMFEDLSRIPRRFTFEVLGLFSIIELLITHNPSFQDIGDSLSHQVRTKMPLLDRRFAEQLRYGAFFEEVEERKAWNALYAFRSLIAHGGETDFDGNTLRILKSHDAVVGFLRHATKLLIRFALKEPRLVADLKEC